MKKIILLGIALISYNLAFSQVVLNNTYEFTNCGQEGWEGPSQGQCNIEYGEDQLSVIDGIQLWTVPISGLYIIDAYGAQGGYGTGYEPSFSNMGAHIIGSFELIAGQEIKMLVGQMGDNGYYEGGGGGGSFVALIDNTPLIVAGGGGGELYG
jgi:hypothetical protein